jgi:hypothetical protein
MEHHKKLKIIKYKFNLFIFNIIMNNNIASYCIFTTIILFISNINLKKRITFMKNEINNLKNHINQLEKENKDLICLMEEFDKSPICYD